jgi:hypothetical protein
VYSRWQEAYLGDTELSLVDISPAISPAPAFGGVSEGGGLVGSFEGKIDAGAADVGEDDEGV